MLRSQLCVARVRRAIVGEAHAVVTGLLQPAKDRPGVAGVLEGRGGVDLPVPEACSPRSASIGRPHAWAGVPADMASALAAPVAECTGE